MKKTTKSKSHNKHKSSKKKQSVGFGTILIFIITGLVAAYIIYKAFLIPFLFAYSSPSPASMQNFKDFRSSEVVQDSRRAENIVTSFFGKVKNKNQKSIAKSSTSLCYQDDVQQGWTTSEYRKKCLIRDVFVVPIQTNFKDETVNFSNKLSSLGVDLNYQKTLGLECFHGKYDEFNGLDKGVSMEIYIGPVQVKESCRRFIPSQTPNLPLTNQGVQYIYKNRFKESQVKQHVQNKAPYLLRIAIEKVYFNEKIK